MNSRICLGLGALLTVSNDNSVYHQSQESHLVFGGDHMAPMRRTVSLGEVCSMISRPARVCSEIGWSGLSWVLDYARNFISASAWEAMWSIEIFSDSLVSMMYNGEISIS